MEDPVRQGIRRCVDGLGTGGFRGLRQQLQDMRGECGSLDGIGPGEADECAGSLLAELISGKAQILPMRGLRHQPGEMRELPAVCADHRQECRAILFR